MLSHSTLMDFASTPPTARYEEIAVALASNSEIIKERGCTTSLATALESLLAAQQRFSHVSNGRFKGGYITRRHGRPAERVHAVQLEMSWRCYLDESRPHEWRAERAAEVAPLLRALVQAMIDWKP